MLEVSSTRGMSTTFSSGSADRDGEGDSTTEGIRPWPLVGLVGSGSSVIGLSSSEFVFPTGVGGVTVVAPDATLLGSHWNPGLTIKLRVSPSLTSYSLSSFPSAKALPFKRRRWTSAGGAPASFASWDLIADMVSARETERT